MTAKLCDVDLEEEEEEFSEEEYGEAETVKAGTACCVENKQKKDMDKMYVMVVKDEERLFKIDSECREVLVLKEDSDLLEEG